MKSMWPIGLVLLAGCSTAPVADFMDFCKPGKMYKDQVTPYGGVCIPGQGTIPIAPGPVPILPTTPPIPIVPGPTPLSTPVSPPIIPPPPPPTLR